MCFRRELVVIAPLLILACSGCQLAGVIAHALPNDQPAAYPGLEGQTVGVMVWADRGVKMDWQGIQLDLARAIQYELGKSTAKELKGTTWPVQPESIIRYQRDHPGIEALPITSVAPKFGVSRVIYVEIQSLSTRSSASMQMFRGSATVAMKVLEVESPTSAKIAYQENDIQAIFPPKSPPEGILNGTDVVMYRGTVLALAREIANRLVTHEVK